MIATVNPSTTLDQRTILMRLAQVGWAVVRTHYAVAGIALAASRVACDLLRRYGIHPEPLACSVTALNEAAAIARRDGLSLKTMHGAEIEQLDSHLILAGRAVRHDFFLDLTVPQFHDPERGLVIDRALLAAARPERLQWELRFALPDNGMLIYHADHRPAWARQWVLGDPADEWRHDLALADLERAVRGEPIEGFKRCACGTRYTVDAWDALPYVGVQEDDETALELRNCPACGSSLSIMIPKTGAAS